MGAYIQPQCPHDHDHDREQQINRPYGAVDISANLKGAVPKPATQKILLALAEKGDVTQKTYGMQCIAYKSRNPSLADDDAAGKATLFVANQNTLDALPEPTIKALSSETDTLLESTKALTVEIKVASAGNPITLFL